MVEHEVKHSRGKIKTSQEAVELAVKALATQLDTLSVRIDEERDLMIDNIVEHFNNKHDDLETKVDNLYGKLVNGVKKFTTGQPPLNKEIISRMLEIEKGIRKEVDKKHQQINKTLQSENSSMRALVTRERQTACQSAHKVERELARIEGKFNQETRRLEKSVVSDASRCNALDSKLESIQETISHKIKIIVANMDHDIDDIRNVSSMDRLDLKNDLMKNLEEYKKLENMKLSEIDGRLESVAKLASRSDSTVSGQTHEVKSLLEKSQKDGLQLNERLSKKINDIYPELDVLRNEIGSIRQQFMIIKSSVRTASSTNSTSGVSSENGETSSVCSEGGSGQSQPVKTSQNSLQSNSTVSMQSSGTSSADTVVNSSPKLAHGFMAVEADV